MKTQIRYVFEDKIEYFISFGTLTFEYVSGTKGDKYYCILAYNEIGERRIIDVTTITNITPLL